MHTGTSLIGSERKAVLSIWREPTTSPTKMYLSYIRDRGAVWGMNRIAIEGSCFDHPHRCIGSCDVCLVTQAAWSHGHVTHYYKSAGF